MLKTIISFNRSARRLPARRAVARGLVLTAFATLTLAALSLPAGLAHAGDREAPSAQNARSARELLAEHFVSSERVTFRALELTNQERTQLARRLGRALPKSSYTFYVAHSGNRVDGYALFDEERGQHELISFATFFDASGNVTDVEVVAYREPYGDGIRAQRFRSQFVGKGPSSKFSPNRDIDTISGSTISSRSMCIGVERATVLLAALLSSTKEETLAAR